MPSAEPPESDQMRQAMGIARAMVAAQMVEVVSGESQLLAAEFEGVLDQLEALPPEEAASLAGDIILALSRLAAFIAAFPAEVLNDAQQHVPGLQLPVEVTGWLDHPQSVLKGAFTLVARMEVERFGD